MNPDSTEEIFIAALQRASPQERLAYLDQACGGEPELRRRVERLLRAHDEAGSLLGAPAQNVARDVAQEEIAQDATTATLPPTGERPGAVIGPYQLLKELGEGGMGTVWVAKQTEPVQRKVALKLIKPGMDSRAVLARFEQERQALALMEHPNIARVFDAGLTKGEPDGVSPGRPYFVMELVNGLPLTRFCDEGKLTPRERLELFVPICQAVQHAHQKGIVHRDLKPSNILVTLYDGRPTPKIIDFGVAKAIAGKLTDETLSTQFGAVIGTLEYMAPEQAGFSATDVDTRADIYSLGVILYELLTGLRPFDRKRLRSAAYDEMVRIIRKEEPQRPSERLSTDESRPSLAALRRTEPKRLAALLRSELDWVVMKCLEKDRNRRYETASGLAREIQRYLSDEPVEARPPSAGYRLRKFARRNKGPVLAASLILLALLAGTGVSAYFAVQADSRARDAVAQRNRADDKAAEALGAAARERQEKDRADDEARQARSERDLARRHLYAADMNLAQKAWEDGRLKRVQYLLDRYRESPPNEEDLRGWEWYHQWRLCHRDRRTLIGHQASVTSVAFSPDGYWLASPSADQTVKIWNLATGQLLKTLDHQAPVSSVAISPDGLFVASGDSSGMVRLWDAAKGRLVRTVKGPPGPTHVAVSPDCRVLAAAFEDRTAKVWELATGKELHTFQWKGYDRQRIYGSFLAISPDGKHLMAGNEDNLVHMWDLATGRPLPGLAHGARVFSFVVGLAWSPDGVRLAVASFNGVIRVWDTVNRKVVHTLETPDDHIRGVAFSPDGQRLASASSEGWVKVWDASTGKLLRSFLGHPAGVQSVAFSPDGQWVASAGYDHHIKIWDAADEQDFRIKHFMGLCLISPEGQRLASYSASFSLPVHDIDTGQSPHSLSLKGDVKRHFTDAVFSRDGQWLACCNGDLIVVWDPATGRTIRELRGHQADITSLALTADGRWLASASKDGMIKVWDFASGAERHTLKGHTGAVMKVTFSPQGAILASASEDGTVKLWDAVSGQDLHILKGHTNAVLRLIFSPDGRLLASSDIPRPFRFKVERTLRLWDVTSGQLVATPSKSCFAITFSGDGRWLAIGNEEGTIQLWDREEGKVAMTLHGHTAWVYSVAFSPDGRRLVSSANDMTVKVWDVRTGQELRTLKGPGNHVYNVAFTPDGQRLICVAGGSAILQIWDARPPTPEVREEQEAIGLLNALFSKPLQKADVLEIVRNYPAASEAVRQRATALAERYQEEKKPMPYNDASWATVKLPFATPALYLIALRQAQVASQLAPDDGHILNTLGVALYRVGNYDEAVRALTRSSELNAKQFGGQPPPADIAFLALAHHRLRHTAEAKVLLERLRGLLEQDRWKNDAEAHAFLRQAEALVAPPAERTE